MNAYDIIKKPLMTEKISSMAEKNIYCFKVNHQATKIDIKRALREMFGADVDEVRLVNLPAKYKMMKKGPGEKRSAYRKAYITLKNRAKLDLTSFSKAEKETKIAEAPAKAEKKEKAAAKPKKAPAKKATKK